MISDKQLTMKIEDDLNELISKDNKQYSCLHQNDITSGKVTTYRFCIRSDAGEFKKGERQGNSVVRYIQGEFTKTGGTSETTQDGRVHLYMGAYITFSVPVKRCDEQENICDCVQRLLGDYFSQNSYGTMEDDIGTTYAYGVNYAIPSVGLRDMAVLQGDHITITVNLQYFFIECGLNSGAVILKIDGYVVPYTLFGISRKCDQEPGINSSMDADKGKIDAVSGFLTTCTILTINFTLPVILSGACSIFDAYLFDGDATAHLVSIYRPFYSGSKYKESNRNYIMVFSDGANNMEERKNASASFTMTLALDSDTQIYSTKAQEYRQAQGGL